MRAWLLALITLFVIGCVGWSHPSLSAPAVPGATIPGAYEIGAPVLTDLWVDPVNGDDNNNGASRATALRTISAAWHHIPSGVPLSDTGYRIQLAAGEYAESTFPVYWEDRHGTAQFPIILNSADGVGAARLTGSLNVFNVDYLYLLGIAIQTSNDVFHCERCRYLLIRNVHMDGGNRAAWETFKANQSQHIYIENSDIHGAQDNAVDFVAVQYGHLRGNRIHNAGDWCAYVKGGSAYITLEGNEIFNCGTGGMTAGQGTGLEFMEAPWLHYEAYGVRVINNVIHHTEGAGLGVNGGYQILMAYNTLYHVGERSHLVEVVFGGRSCDAAADGCAQRLAVGGWGTAAIGSENAQPIPNQNVFIVNNLIVNPDHVRSGWQHFAIHNTRTPLPGSNIPSPAHTDSNLQIRGNVIWNGPANWPLGLGAESGCQPANPTCNESQIHADNSINTVQPLFIDAAGGNFHLGNATALPTPIAIASFPLWNHFMPAVPAWNADTAVPMDRDGHPRAGGDLVGAYASPTALPHQLYLPALNGKQN